MFNRRDMMKITLGVFASSLVPFVTTAYEWKTKGHPKVQDFFKYIASGKSLKTAIKTNKGILIGPELSPTYINDSVVYSINEGLVIHEDIEIEGFWILTNDDEIISYKNFIYHKSLTRGDAVKFSYTMQVNFSN